MKTLATITLNVPQCSQGLHLRWYANGWHYLTLRVGDESYLTAGLFSNTEANAKQRIAVEDVPAANIDALIALARVGSFDVLTPKGWRNGTFDGGDITTFETDTDYYRAEFVLNVYGKTYPYSPATIAPPALSDLDILRQIRDANPTSLLPALWSEDKDPYTQWGGVVWQVQGAIRKVSALTVAELDLTELPNISSLGSLKTLDCSDNQLTVLDVSGIVGLTALYCIGTQIVSLDLSKQTNLTDLNCASNKLVELDLSEQRLLRFLQCNVNALLTLTLPTQSVLELLYCGLNKLTSLPTLAGKGSIIDANFKHNILSPAEVARLKALGFTDAQLLPQDI